MNELELFTQRAYLEVAAIQKDSKIFDEPDVAFVRCSSVKERWTNAVVRATHRPKDFAQIDLIVDEYDEQKINFNWHLWHSSSAPELRAHLVKEKKMVVIGEGEALLKKLPHVIHPPAQTTDMGFFELSSTFLASYIDAKMKAWKIDPRWKGVLTEVTSRQIPDRNRIVYVAIKDNRVVAAAGAYVEGSRAYLRGSFCDLDFRGHGLYKKLVAFREYELHRHGVNELTTLADGVTSAPILTKMGYGIFSKFTILARRASEWVSL